MEIYIISITETHWTTDIPTMWDKYEHVIIHPKRQDGIHRQCVTLILNKLSVYQVDY